MAELKKSLGTLRLTFYGVGTIVGGGIYTVIGAAAGQAGTDLWLSFIFAAIAASVSAMSYAELSSTWTCNKKSDNFSKTYATFLN